MPEFPEDWSSSTGFFRSATPPRLENISPSHVDNLSIEKISFQQALKYVLKTMYVDDGRK